jgi:hypothetical protein
MRIRSVGHRPGSMELRLSPDACGRSSSWRRRPTSLESLCDVTGGARSSVSSRSAGLAQARTVCRLLPRGDRGGHYEAVTDPWQTSSTNVSAIGAAAKRRGLTSLVVTDVGDRRLLAARPELDR